MSESSSEVSDAFSEGWQLDDQHMIVLPSPGYHWLLLKASANFREA